MSFDNNTTLSLFQFHKGTIKTDTTTVDGSGEQYFNSIKVRLKPSTPRPWLLLPRISIP